MQVYILNYSYYYLNDYLIAGYGIGAILTVQLVVPFVRFDPLLELNSTLNESLSEQLDSNDIHLEIPYSISGCFGFIVLICFIFAQYFETKNRERVEKFPQQIPMEQKSVFYKSVNKKPTFLNRRIVQLVFLILLFISISGLVSTISTFLLTYLTKGPSGFEIKTCYILRTLYWVFFVLGRFSAAILAFKMNSLLFFLILVIINIVLFVLFIIPILSSCQIFYWFIISALGFFTGPIIPSGFMVAKHILSDLNSFLVSLFCIGLGFGMVLSQFLTGFLLDKFNPRLNWLGYTSTTNSTFIIPIYLLAWMVFCAFIFSIILFIYKLSNCHTVESTGKSCN